MDNGSLLVAGHVLEIVDGKVTSTPEQVFQAKAALKMKESSGFGNDQELAFLREFIKLAEGPGEPVNLSGDAQKGTLDDALKAAKEKILTDAPKSSTGQSLADKIAAARTKLNL